MGSRIPGSSQRLRGKLAKLDRCPDLKRIVEERLIDEHSPEQISDWLALNYPDNEAMRLSHEAIYRALYVQSRGTLRRELTRHLRSGRVKRRPRGSSRSGQGHGQIRDMVMISERPAEVADRAVPGHWEGDLLMGDRTSAIATLVERQTRYVQLVCLPDGFRAEPVREALAESVSTLPEQLRRSLTWDQGHEMAEHKQFTIDSGLLVYFCDPHSPTGKEARTRTPTGCCVSTSPSAQASRESARTSSTGSPTSQPTTSKDARIQDTGGEARGADRRRARPCRRSLSSLGLRPRLNSDRSG